MLSDNNIQLFHKLLDSLSSNLRDLSIKYEVLVRQIDDRSQTLGTVDTSVKEIRQGIAAALIDLKEIIRASAEGAVAMQETNSGINSVQDTLRRMDVHLGSQDARMDGILVEIRKLPEMAAILEETNKGLKPVAKLSGYLSKPLMWILIVYMILTTFLAANKMVESISKRAKLAEEVKQEILLRERQHDYYRLLGPAYTNQIPYKAP